MRNGDREGKALGGGNRAAQSRQRVWAASAERVGHFGLLSLPSPCLPSQGVDRWLNQHLTPPLLYSPAWRAQSELRGHPRRAPPPAWPASCPFPGSTGQRIPGKTTTWVCPAQPSIWGVPPTRARGPETCVEGRCGQSKEGQRKTMGREEESWTQTKRERGTKQEEGGERRGARKNNCAGSRGGGSWPGGAGPGPGPSPCCPAWPSPQHGAAASLRALP